MKDKKGSATILVPTPKKIVAHDVVSVRPARTGDSPPMIITIPKKIVDAMQLKKGEDLRIYTDSEKIYIDRFEVEQSI